MRPDEAVAITSSVRSQFRSEACDSLRHAFQAHAAAYQLQFACLHSHAVGVHKRCQPLVLVGRQIDYSTTLHEEDRVLPRQRHYRTLQMAVNVLSISRRFFVQAFALRRPHISITAARAESTKGGSEASWVGNQEFLRTFALRTYRFLARRLARCQTTGATKEPGTARMATKR